jgi:TPP-dependent pyruvate/acetoin dehydrogenase alpha subunit
MLRVFENRMLRRIFGPKRDEVTREWRKLHKEQLYELYSALNVIRVIKSRRMRWAGMQHVWGEDRCIQGFGGKT